MNKRKLDAVVTKEKKRKVNSSYYQNNRAVLLEKAKDNTQFSKGLLFGMTTTFLIHFMLHCLLGNSVNIVYY